MMCLRRDGGRRLLSGRARGQVEDHPDVEQAEEAALGLLPAHGREAQDLARREVAVDAREDEPVGGSEGDALEAQQRVAGEGQNAVQVAQMEPDRCRDPGRSRPRRGSPRRSTAAAACRSPGSSPGPALRRRSCPSGHEKIVSSTSRTWSARASSRPSASSSPRSRRICPRRRPVTVTISAARSRSHCVSRPWRTSVSPRWHSLMLVAP